MTYINPFCRLCISLSKEVHISFASYVPYILFFCKYIFTMGSYIWSGGWIRHRGQHCAHTKYLISSHVISRLHEECGLGSGCGFVRRGQHCIHTKYQIFTHAILRCRWGVSYIKNIKYIREYTLESPAKNITKSDMHLHYIYLWI